MAGSALQATTRAAMVMWRRERKAEMWRKGEESPTAARQSGGGYGEVVALPLAAMETGTGAVAGEGTDWSREVRPQRWVPLERCRRPRLRTPARGWGRPSGEPTTRGRRSVVAS
uniref:Uncharacterized protein n=1 Tax=Oryza rufipogon TaxID=4529 RepID=A0A0E0QZX9_ORYRU